MKSLALFFGVMATFLISGQAYSQCRTSHCYSTPYVRPVIREVIVETPVPIAYPVLVPAFQFQYQPPVVIQAAPVHPVQQPVMNQQQPGYGNGQDKIRDLAKALLDEMRRQSEQELNGDGPPMAVDPNAPPSVPQVPQAPPQGSFNPDQLTPLAINALSRACAQCHTGVGSKGETVIFSSPGVFNQSAPLRSMRREIDAGRMPPQYFHYRLTAEELQVLRIWLPPARE